MTSVRSKELGSCLGSFLVHWFALGVRYDHAASKVDLRICTDILDLRLAGFIRHERTQIHARRSGLENPMDRGAW